MLLGFQFLVHSFPPFSFLLYYPQLFIRRWFVGRSLQWENRMIQLENTGFLSPTIYRKLLYTSDKIMSMDY